MSSYDTVDPYVTASERNSQLYFSITVVTVVFVVGFLGEAIQSMMRGRAQQFIKVMDYTASSEDNTVVVRQDFTKYKEAIPLGLSVNERTGVEFAYSFYLFVQPSTFTGDAKLRHVMHKGYLTPWPLMGPGVFIWGHENTMRVVMNTFKNPYTHVDIRNIPVQKWFHVVLNCNKGALDVYVNGALANRIQFRNTVPYQNFQDLVIFSQIRTEALRSPGIAALPEGESMPIDGAFQGYLSNLKYARYALSMSEIQRAMNEGPSVKRVETRQEVPPYMADSWWTDQTRMS